MLLSRNNNFLVCGLDEEQLGQKVMSLNASAEKVFHLLNLHKILNTALPSQYNMKFIQLRGEFFDCFPHTCEQSILS